ncbi:MAG: ANTAR domain-containing protein [Clostridia bacterium]
MLAGKAQTSVLIVSGSKKGAEMFVEFLPCLQFAPITYAFNAGEAKRMLVNNPTDMVIINTPLPDDFGVQLALDISQNESMGVLLFVKSEMYEQITYKTEDYGILTLPKPISKQTIMQSISLLVATKVKLKALQERTFDLENKIDDIRIINRAKLLLIEQYKMSEIQAHRYIEKQAMDKCVKRREIAENIIKTYEDPQ